MALTDCKSCGESVDRSAKACPHCGVSSPGGWFVYQGVGSCPGGGGGGGCLQAMGCLFVLLLALWFFSCPLLLV